MSETYFNCPYCDKEISEDVDGDMNPYTEYESICYECKKQYNYRIIFSVEINAYKKDLIQDGKVDKGLGTNK